MCATSMRMLQELGQEALSGPSGRQPTSACCSLANTEQKRRKEPLCENEGRKEGKYLGDFRFSQTQSHTKTQSQQRTSRVFGPDHGCCTRIHLPATQPKYSTLWLPPDVTTRTVPVIFHAARPPCSIR
eukprot:m.545876 g.545876  ORF g.545876 m.545876 type:complete len:128 (-) comp57676_c1_seq7:506-889(-)